jgi:DNA-binding NarL/FixJ family response regulator
MHTFSKACDVDEQAPCLAVAVISERERQIVRLVALGYRNTEIATKLAISPATVKTHVVNIFRKVGVRSRHELEGYALRVGIV